MEVTEALQVTAPNAGVTPKPRSTLARVPTRRPRIFIASPTRRSVGDGEGAGVARRAGRRGAGPDLSGGDAAVDREGLRRPGSGGGRLRKRQAVRQTDQRSGSRIEGH